MTKRILLSIFLTCAAARALPAQEEVAGGTLTPLRLTLTFSPAPDGRESRVSFALYVLADAKAMTTLRSGREVAVPSAGNQYRNVGINVTCRASTSGDRFHFDLEIERSALVEESDPVHPSFQTFSARSSFRLRDGDEVKLVAGPDLGEIVAALRILKN